MVALEASVVRMRQSLFFRPQTFLDDSHKFYTPLNRLCVTRHCCYSFIEHCKCLAWILHLSLPLIFFGLWLHLFDMELACSHHLSHKIGLQDVSKDELLELLSLCEQLLMVSVSISVWKSRFITAFLRLGEDGKQRFAFPNALAFLKG